MTFGYVLGRGDRTGARARGLQRDRGDAGLREDGDGEDPHPRGRERRHRRRRQRQDPGQGRWCRGGPAAAHLRGEGTGGRPHPGRLRRPEGVHASPGAWPPRRILADRAKPPHTRVQAQHQQDDLPQVLCYPAPGTKNCRKKKCGHSNQLRRKKLGRFKYSFRF